MEKTGVRIKYGNFAPEAKENFTAITTDSELDTLSQLQRYNLHFPNYSNACELYQTALDGTAIAFPSDVKNSNIGFLSKQISGDDYLFSPPVLLEMKSDGQYTSQALSFTFDTHNNIFPTRINIKWYREDVLLSDMDFNPDSSTYLCQNEVQNYDRIVISFFSLNMPKNRLRLRSIDYGYGTWFDSKNIRSVKIIQEINPTSSEISINTADIAIDIEEGNDFLFQKKQPLSIFYNDVLKSTTFINNFKRISKKLWNIQTEDYIGLLDGIPYHGGMYSDTYAMDIISDIFSVANIPYAVDSAFYESKVTGYIPYTNCREALMQVAFAIQAAVDTSNNDFVHIFDIKDDIKQNIPANRIMQGQTVDEGEKLTALEITAHSYIKTEDEIEVYNARESGKSNENADGTYERIMVKFAEPLHDLKIIGDGDFAVDETGNELKHTNYAIIYAREDDFQLIGKKYSHITTTKRKNNPLFLASDIEKIATIDGATLVSVDNIDKVCEKCYNWLANERTINSRIIEGKHYHQIVLYGQKNYGSFKYSSKDGSNIIYDEPVNVGDNVSVFTEYYGNVEGLLYKQSFSLNGGIIVKDALIRG